MVLSDYREEIKLLLTGDITEIELDDNTIERTVKTSLRELQRYISSSEIITIPYRSCIELNNKDHTNGKEIEVSNIVNIYRADNMGGTNSGVFDPAYAAQYQMIYGMGNLHNFQNAIYNYGAWSTLQQIRNTMSTDLSYRYDKSQNKLYVNVSNGTPQKITIEYIPLFTDVEQITSEYWIDMLVRLSLAKIKMIVGGIRSKYEQTNALWRLNGSVLLNEGREELAEVRQMLLDNSELSYPID